VKCRSWQRLGAMRISPCRRPPTVDKLARSMRYMSVSDPWRGELLIGMEEISLAADDLRFSLSLSGAAHARFLTPEAKDFSSFGKLGAERRQSTSSATASPLAACGNHSAGMPRVVVC